ncbi:MAG: hypothetical protein KIT09_32520 [Bryobacteraceae bacterium]|nr:hypothetical protein [Bryobacteraceae bacterium]
MSRVEKYELHIDAFSPATIPMARLSEYMADFAALLGHEEHVRFEKLVAGSLAIISRVEPIAEFKVQRRLEEARYGTAPKAAMEALSAIDDKLAADNAVGSIRRGSTKIIEFPGRNRPPVESRLGPVVQRSTLDGEVIQVGGRDETINVHVRSGDDFHRCITTKAIARRLAQHMFGPAVRLRGRGTWSRAESGDWTLHRFDIESFEVLDETPLSKLFDGLRTRLAPAEGERQNPIDLMRQLREE